MTDIQEWSLLLIVVCIFMLAAINIFLVLQLLKGVKDESIQLGKIVAQCQAIMAEQGSVKEMVAQSATDGLDDAALSELDGALSQSLEVLEQADAGTQALLEDLQQAAPEDLAAWRDLNAERIEGLLAQQKQMRARIDSLQELLANANATILNLRSRPRRNGGESAGDSKLVEEVQQARRNAARLSTELNAANASLQSLTEKLATREMMLSEASERHSQEKSALEARITALSDQIQSVQDSFDRTIVEKTFIEDAFLAIEERDKRD